MYKICFQNYILVKEHLSRAKSLMSYCTYSEFSVLILVKMNSFSL